MLHSLCLFLTTKCTDEHSISLGFVSEHKGMYQWYLYWSTLSAGGESMQVTWFCLSIVQSLRPHFNQILNICPCTEFGIREFTVSQSASTEPTGPPHLQALNNPHWHQSGTILIKMLESTPKNNKLVMKEDKGTDSELRADGESFVKLQSNVKTLQADNCNLPSLDKTCTARFGCSYLSILGRYQSHRLHLLRLELLSDLLLQLQRTDLH